MPAANAPLKQVSADFRRSAAGIKLGSLLFNGDTQKLLTPSTITNLFSAAGVPVPKGVAIGTDVAQIIMAGGAIASTAETAESIGAYASPTSAIINASLDIMSRVGLLDPKSPGASAVRMGTEAVLVVASGGLNVLADIAFLVDFIGSLFNGLSPEQLRKMAEYQNIADNMALAKNKNWFSTREASQSAYAANQFSDLHNGKIGMFTYMANIADNAPDLFLNYFPDMKTFVPPQMCVHDTTAVYTPQHTFMVSGHNITLESYTGKSQISFQTIAQYSKPALEDIFFSKYVVQPSEPYRMLNPLSSNLAYIKAMGFPPKSSGLGPFDSRFTVCPRINLQDLALLSLFPPYFSYMASDYDIRKSLLSIGITPYDMGYTFLGDMAISFDTLNLKTKQAMPAITFNGVDYFTTEQQKANQAIDSYDKMANSSNTALKNAVLGDKRGDIKTALSFPQFNSIIQEWGFMPLLSDDMLKKCGSIYSSIAPSLTNAPVQNSYRNIRNYWSILSILDKMQKDGYFNDKHSAAWFSQINAYLPQISAIEEKAKRLQFLSIARRQNQMARANIASFYGTTADKITLTPGRNGQLAKVQVN